MVKVSLGVDGGGTSTTCVALDAATGDVLGMGFHSSLFGSPQALFVHFVGWCLGLLLLLSSSSISTRTSCR
jgi:hypothetical protein